MWHSLQQLALLDGATRVYCAHEYTLANLDFAMFVDPHNGALQDRMQQDKAKRQRELPTIPSTIGTEKATNPFLRPLDSSFVTAYAASKGIDADALSVFTHIRQQKDHY